MPFFSVVIATYNREKFIPKAIKSVLEQTFEDWELLIIDDGSTDNSKEIIAGFLSDNRIKYCYQENQERSVARNNGIAQSQGQYICFLDSDDYYLPNHLAVLYEHIKKNNFPTAMFHTYQTYVRNGQKLDTVFNDKYKNSGYSEVECRLLNNVWLFSPAVQTIAAHRDIFKNILFDTYPIPFECYELMGRIAAGYNIVKIDESTVVMQLHEANSTAYDEKFLLDSLKAFTYIVSNPIYDSIKGHVAVRDKFYEIYMGLADFNSRIGNKKPAIQYLLKGLYYKRSLKNIRHLLGITKNIILSN